MLRYVIRPRIPVICAERRRILLVEPAVEPIVGWQPERADGIVGGEHRGREGLRISLAFCSGSAQPGLSGRGDAAHVGAPAVPGTPAFCQGVVIEKVGS